MVLLPYNGFSHKGSGNGLCVPRVRRRTSYSVSLFHDKSYRFLVDYDSLVNHARCRPAGSASPASAQPINRETKWKERGYHDERGMRTRGSAHTAGRWGSELKNKKESLMRQFPLTNCGALCVHHSEHPNALARVFAMQRSPLAVAARSVVELGRAWSSFSVTTAFKHRATGVKRIVCRFKYSHPLFPRMRISFPTDLVGR